MRPIQGFCNDHPGRQAEELAVRYEVPLHSDFCRRRGGRNRKGIWVHGGRSDTHGVFHLAGWRGRRTFCTRETAEAKIAKLSSARAGRSPCCRGERRIAEGVAFASREYAIGTEEYGTTTYQRP